MVRKKNSLADRRKGRRDLSGTPGILLQGPSPRCGMGSIDIILSRWVNGRTKSTISEETEERVHTAQRYSQMSVISGFNAAETGVRMHAGPFVKSDASIGDLQGTGFKAMIFIKKSFGL